MTENITYNHRGIRTSPQPSTLIGGVAAAEHVGDIGITQGNQQHTRHTTELELVKEATENDEGLPLKKRGGATTETRGALSIFRRYHHLSSSRFFLNTKHNKGRSSTTLTWVKLQPHRKSLPFLPRVQQHIFMVKCFTTYWIDRFLLLFPPEKYTCFGRPTKLSFSYTFLFLPLLFRQKKMVDCVDVTRARSDGMFLWYQRTRSSRQLWSQSSIMHPITRVGK